jgi:hypothetical protein
VRDGRETCFEVVAASARLADSDNTENAVPASAIGAALLPPMAHKSPMSGPVVHEKWDLPSEDHQFAGGSLVGNDCIPH